MTLRPRPVIIGLVGPSGGGKTTVCEYLQSDYQFDVIHVATPLKRAFVEMFRCPWHLTERPYIDEPQAFLGGVTPREVLEHLGTKLHEVAPAALPHLLNQTIHRMIKRGCTRILADGTRILVDGIRRATEAEVVKLAGGTVWRAAAAEVDPNKPCDISQQDVASDAVVPWIAEEEARYKYLDGLLAPLL